MAWADGTLWVGQHRARKIHQLDPETGAILRTLESNRFVTGVTWVDGELWHATWEGDESALRRIDPESGEVLTQLDMPAGVGVSGLESDAASRCSAAAAPAPNCAWSEGRTEDRRPRSQAARRGTDLTDVSPPRNSPVLGRRCARAQREARGRPAVAIQRGGELEEMRFCPGLVARARRLRRRRSVCADGADAGGDRRSLAAIERRGKGDDFRSRAARAGRPAA